MIKLIFLYGQVPPSFQNRTKHSKFLPIFSHPSLCDCCGGQSWEEESWHSIRAGFDLTYHCGFLSSSLVHSMLKYPTKPMNGCAWKASSSIVIIFGNFQQPSCLFGTLQQSLSCGAPSLIWGHLCLRRDWLPWFFSYAWS